MGSPGIPGLCAGCGRPATRDVAGHPCCGQCAEAREAALSLQTLGAEERAELVRLRRLEGQIAVQRARAVAALTALGRHADGRVLVSALTLQLAATLALNAVACIGVGDEHERPPRATGPRLQVVKP